ncbi:hypothetical protein KC622_03090, partial [Candidatus Dojkabacteria bacterium]|nr:hypothetical protein [Candidatus Dojkabacteria bacterium]
SNIADFCISNDLNYFVFNSVKSKEVFDILIRTYHDFLLVIGLSQLIPSEILDLSMHHTKNNSRFSESHGAIGMHPTLLPIGRGRAPIPWTILKELKNTGVSVFFLDNGADTGPIISQDIFQISDIETAYTLFNKVADSHYQLGKIISLYLAEKKVRSVIQDELQVSVWPKRIPRDGWIDFENKSIDIVRLVNATTHPYPGSFFVYKDQTIIVSDASISLCNYRIEKSLPGLILEVDQSGCPHICTTDGVVRLCTRNQDVDYQIGEYISSYQTKVLDNNA